MRLKKLFPSLLLIFIALMAILSYNMMEGARAVWIGQRDLVIHIEECVAWNEPDGTKNEPGDTFEPYILIFINEKQKIQIKKSVIVPRKTKETATEENHVYECLSAVFKWKDIDREWRIQFIVMDDDCHMLSDGIDDVLAVGDGDLRNLPRRLKSSYERYATITIRIDYCRPCHGYDDFVYYGYRECLASVTPTGAVVPVAVNLYVNEAFHPSNATVSEVLPLGFTYVSGSGYPWEPLIIPFWNDTYIMLEWEFMGADVMNRTIRYATQVTSNSGTYSFAGEVVADNSTTITMGQVDISVERPIGGIVVPVDKFVLLASYIALTSTILAATAATAIYIKHVKHRKKKQ